MSDNEFFSYASLGWVLVLAYVGVIVFLVARASKHTKSMSDYALGSRAFSPVAVGLALAASMTSAATFIINPGLVAYYGLSGVLSMAVMLPLGALISLVVLTKGFRKQGESVKALTLAQWIGSRYHSKAFGFFFGILSLLLLTFVVLICVGLTKVLATMLNLSEIYVLAGLIIFVFGYMMFGGANSMVYTNTIQAILMIVVAVVLLASGYLHFEEGLSGFLTKLEGIDKNLTKAFNPESSLFRDAFEVMFCQFVVGAAVVCQPHIITKSLLLRKEQEVNRYLSVGVAVQILFFFVVIVGLYARLAIPDLLVGGESLSVDSVVSVYVIQRFPLFLGLLVIVGLLSAGLSTLEGLIQSLSITISQDILLPLSGEESLNKVGLNAMRLNRIIIILLGIIAFILSYNQLIAPNLSVAIFAQNGVYAFFIAAFIPVLFGMFIRRLPLYVPVLASLTAVGVHFIFYYGRLTPYLKGVVRNPGVSAAIGIMASVAVAFLALAWSRLRAKEKKESEVEVMHQKQGVSQ